VRRTRSLVPGLRVRTLDGHWTGSIVRVETDTMTVARPNEMAIRVRRSAIYVVDKKTVTLVCSATGLQRYVVTEDALEGG
jgi:preprotein translocase subunit YajC